MGKFPAIMKHLHPKRILEVVEVPHHTARGKYIVKSPVVRNYKEFEAACIDYVVYHEKAVYGNTLHPMKAQARANRYLQQVRVGSLEDSAFYGTTGTNGGMAYIYDSLLRGFINEHREEYINFVYTTFINPLSGDEQYELAKELRQQIELLSPYVQYISALDMVNMGMVGVLRKYIQSLSNFGALWKM